MKQLLFISAIVFALAGCKKVVDCAETGCLDTCPGDTVKVCGCNGKTYANSCKAKCHNIHTFTQGECQ